jgi:predicted lysophospholipase L1 biosynthesis ABC-type transport system permease subunit
VTIAALLRSGGWGRPALVTACTAMVSALLLVVVALLLLPRYASEVLFSLVADEGTRYGTAFGTALLTVPPLALLHQAVRVGTAARERRLAAFRLAGATPRQVRSLGALEVAVPAALGAVLGWPLFLLLRALLGGVPHEAVDNVVVSSDELRLVPTSVTPTWWQVLAVVLVVTVAAAAAGSLALRRVVVTPLGIARRGNSRRPRPWGALLLAAALAIALWLALAQPDDDDLVASAVVALAVGGMLGLASWSTWLAGRVVEQRAQSAPALLAARRLVVDPRPAGRASAAVGAIALVSGGAAGIAADIVSDPHVDRFYVVSLLLVAAGLLAALAAVTGSLAVHATESLLDHRRSTASLAALGTPSAVVVQSQRWEAMVAAVPVAIIGVVLGAASTTALVLPTTEGWLVVVAVVLATPLLVALAAECAVQVTRPVAVRAASPANLRTE